MPEPVPRTRGKLDISNWVRTLQLPHIIVGWGVLVLAGLLIGAVADRVRWTFAGDIAANLVPDLFVAGLALVAAEVVFKFRERQEDRAVEQRRLREHRAEEARKVIEAQRKAYSIIIREMYDNEQTLGRILGTLQQGGMPPALTTLKKENWELLVQGPLVVHLPVELVWTLHEAYYESERMLHIVMAERGSTMPQAWDKPAERLRAEVEAELVRTRDAIKMLEDARSEG